MALKVRLTKAVYNGCAFLLSHYDNGIFEEFQLRHGPSWAWSTSFVASSLAEFNLVPAGLVEKLLSLQHACGGWSYNQNSLPDADSTLRVIQALQKTGFNNHPAVTHGFSFVLQHQQTDGGIATYLPKTLERMGYAKVSAWAESHPCVTALSVNVLPDCDERRQAREYLDARLSSQDFRAYWWSTPLYVAYEAGVVLEAESVDPVELALRLMSEAKCKISDRRLISQLLGTQLLDGSFPQSKVFRIPRVTLDEIDSSVEIVPDIRRLMSTSAAVVALSRQGALL